MIETEITLFPTAQIKDPSSRQRFELDKNHANDLAISIKESDLLHPIIVDKQTNKYIAGQHRLEAFRINEFLERECKWPGYQNWTHIPVRFASDVSKFDLQVLELIENIHSKKMDWKEIALAVQTLYNMQPDSEQTLEHLAILTCTNKMHVSNCLRAAKYINDNDELVLAATSLSGAMNVIGRKEDRLMSDLTESIRDSIVSENKPEPSEDWDIAGLAEEPIPHERAPGEKNATEIRNLNTPFQAVNTDFLEWAAQYSGPRFNLLHCDFPYGIDYDKSGFDYAKHHSIYGDSKDLYFALLSALVDNSETLLADSAHLIFWYNSRYYDETISMLTRAGFKVWPHHLIWHKSDNAGVLADYRRGPRHTHETALFATRGDRKIVKPVADSYSCATTRESGHVSEKPLEVLRHFFQLVVDETTRVLDPTAGSYNSILAAREAGAKSGIGVELDAGYANRGARCLVAGRDSTDAKE